jgi:hypothetical protein
VTLTAERNPRAKLFVVWHNVSVSGALLSITKALATVVAPLKACTVVLPLDFGPPFRLFYFILMIFSPMISPRDL